MARISLSLTKAMKETVGGEFILVELGSDGPQPVYDGDGNLLRFTDGAEASLRAEYFTMTLGKKVQPRRASDNDWQAREAKRMGDGTYRLLPWHTQAFWAELKDAHTLHFPHVALEKRAMISFTESPEKGAADIQTRIKPGRYLERFFSDKLNSHVIRDLCCIFAKVYEDNKLQFADTADDIEEVYLSGPTSCMTKETSQFGVGVHPVRMYAAGDLQVAYLRRNGRIVARAVVWPEKKIYNTIYGDKALLSSLLSKQGYKNASPEGARLVKHKHVIKGEGHLYAYVVPHVDGVSYVVDEGEFLRTGQGRVSIDSVMGISMPGGAGVTEKVGYKCVECGKESTSRHVSSVYADERGNVVKHLCKKNHLDLICACQVSGTLIMKTVALPLGPPPHKEGYVWKRSERDTVICQGSGFRYMRQVMVTLVDKRMVGPHFLREHCAPCPSCGFYFDKKDPCGCAQKRRTPQKGGYEEYYYQNAKDQWKTEAPR